MKNIEYLLTGEEVLRYDRNTSEYFKVPEIVLMEQAALMAVKRICAIENVKSKKILIMSGTGNNGGDGMAVARLLSQRGAVVTVFIVSNHSLEEVVFSNSASLQYEILRQMKLPIVTKFIDDSYDMIVDCIFGVGLNREITGNIYNVILEVNKNKAFKVALDIPSGIHAATGQIMGCAFKADVTITFAFYKRGLFLSAGREYSGEIYKEIIGITEESFLSDIPKMFALTGKVKDYLPVRSCNGHKGTFGKILVVAGSKNVGGAAFLAAKAAMKSGAGMVRIFTHKNQYQALFPLLPEALYDSYENGDEIPGLIKNAIEWADCIILGPGIGLEEEGFILWKEVIYGEKKPLILDADGLTILSNEKNTRKLEELQKSEDTFRNLIFTPHMLEFSRMVNQPVSSIIQEGEDISLEYAKRMKAVLVRKDARTFICDYYGRMALNLSGDSGMATAGSGDVLCGIIAAFLVNYKKMKSEQGGMHNGYSFYESLSFVENMNNSFEAAVRGVYIHGKAGEEAVARMNSYSMIAGDLVDSLERILR